MKEIYPDIKDVIGIAHELHAKTDEALANALAYLSQDYDIKDCSKDKDHPHNGYYAHLKPSVYTRMTKCNFCLHLNTVLGCKCHGFRCYKCKQILWVEYMKGGTIRFSFANDERHRYVSLFIHSYDESSQSILCYTKQARDNSWCTVPKEQFAAYMEQFKDDYEVVNIDGKKLYKFYYNSKGMLRGDEKIHMAETRRAPMGNRCNYRETSIYKGQEFESYGFSDNIPACESYMLYRTKPLEHNDRMSASIINMARQSSRCDYYYQDGRTAFYETPLRWIRSIVEHFTDLDIKEFDKFLDICRNDGPGFIIHLADWVGKKIGVKQYVQNEPNIGNLLVGVSKMVHGQYMTDNEKEAMKMAAKDRKTLNYFRNIMGQYIPFEPFSYNWED